MFRNLTVEVQYEKSKISCPPHSIFLIQWLNTADEQFTNYLPDLPTPDFPMIAILIFR